MKAGASDAREHGRHDGLHVWRAFLVMLGLIIFSSVAGRQLYEMMTPAAVWALIAGGGAAALLALAFVYRGPLSRRALTIGLIVGISAFVAAVLAGVMTPAEITHVALFGALGYILALDGR